MITASLDDCRWLVSDDAKPWLAKVSADLANTPAGPAVIRSLRTALGESRSALVLQQVELRAKAREKFSRADELFFTRRGLEQATDEQIAAYKARRFADCLSAADLCCGIGGDAMALVADHELTLVDREPVALLLAAANLERLNPSIPPKSFAEAIQPRHIAEAHAWHIDPDRRPTGPRTSRIEFGEPGIEVLETLLKSCPHAAIKLAPAADVPAEWRGMCQREWIESRGECRQQVAWFGRFVETSDAHEATLIDNAGEAVSFSGRPDVPMEEAMSVKSRVFDPTSSLTAAHLVGALTETLGLQGVDARSLYLTGDVSITHPHLQAFELKANLPLDVRQLRTYLREQGIGRVEIKKRGVDVTPEQLRPQLQLSGDEEATILLTPTRGSVRALVCHRVRP